MATLESDVVESTDGEQAVKARFNPWWLIAAVLVVIGAVIFGAGKLRAPEGDAMIPNVDDPE